ncbi:MAG: DUF5667 domain-containing protein [Bacteroidales bacterium]
MRKLFIFLLGVSLTAAIPVLFSNPAYANHREDVLGANSTAVLSIPPTTEGPGLVLPDSPLYFVDQVKQGFRLLLAFTPEQKATIRNAIAGERLAELRIMLAKNNVSGIRTALQGLADNLKAASENLTDAKLTGRNIDLLAKSINDSIKDKQKILTDLGGQATGEMRAQVTAAKEALKIAKVKTEENLPTDLLVNETIDDLYQQIGDNVGSASLSAAEINRAIDVLTRLASQAAQENQLARREALINAINVKNLINEFQRVLISMQKAMPEANSKTIKPPVPTITPTP